MCGVCSSSCIFSWETVVKCVPYSWLVRLHQSKDLFEGKMILWRNLQHILSLDMNVPHSGPVYASVLARGVWVTLNMRRNILPSFTYFLIASACNESGGTTLIHSYPPLFWCDVWIPQLSELWLVGKETKVCADCPRCFCLFHSSNGAPRLFLLMQLFCDPCCWHSSYPS